MATPAWVLWLSVFGVAVLRLAGCLSPELFVLLWHASCALSAMALWLQLFLSRLMLTNSFTPIWRPDWPGFFDLVGVVYFKELRIYGTWMVVFGSCRAKKGAPIFLLKGLVACMYRNCVSGFSVVFTRLWCQSFLYGISVFLCRLWFGIAGFEIPHLFSSPRTRSSNLIAVLSSSLSPGRCRARESFFVQPCKTHVFRVRVFSKLHLWWFRTLGSGTSHFCLIRMGQKMMTFRCGYWCRWRLFLPDHHSCFLVP